MNWFSSWNQKLFKGKSREARQLMYRVIPTIAGDLFSKYFRIEVSGREHLPAKGPCLIIPNHSGFSGFDAFLLAHQMEKSTQTLPTVLTHRLWFATRTTSQIMRNLGFVEATTQNGTKALKQKKHVVLFPEGEKGNFKPSNKAYHLQEFRRGFVRMALREQCTIIPTLIIGAEESHINLARWRFRLKGKSAILPLPLNIIPLPAKWHIIFMEPIQLPYLAEEVNNRELVRELSQEIREKMQARLSLEVSKRKNLYF